jgi:hypothetical protein
MAYVAVPAAATRQPNTEEAETKIRALLGDLAERKEFRIARQPVQADSAANRTKPRWPGFTRAASKPQTLFLPGLRLSGAQLFVRNFENPDTEYARLLLYWQTGTGKSIAAIAMGHEFVRNYRARNALGGRAPTVYIVGFTKEIIQEDMLRHPEFGFISQTEIVELRQLRAAASAAGPASMEARQLSGLVGVLRRRITDRTRGGYYQFYGYKEFANRLFVVTRQGEERGFDVQALYSRELEAFGARLAEAVRRGDVLVNEELLDELRGGLLVADEIHNVYNILEENNYGIALQYALDVLGADAPRAVFMSYTPMTGSAAEVVDLLNLLVPRAALPGGMPLRRSDFFSKGVAVDESAPHAARREERADHDEDSDEEPASTFVVSQLREGALERIAHLSAGRVSFLLDADVGAYPRRLFEGEEVAGVPYLRMTLCPMSAFHAQTLAHERQARDAETPGAPRSEASGFAANAYTLYDMAFPNPDFGAGAALEGDQAAYGLYKSGEAPTKLMQAPDSWRAAAGVIIEQGAEAGLTAGTTVITGSFLGPGRLQHYSSKYWRAVDETLKAVRAGPGKIMIYHHRVRMSGVLLIQEALRMNGFADETSAPVDATICAVCGVARSVHPPDSPELAPGDENAVGPAARTPEGHRYVPARFVVAHSDVDRAVMVRSLARFNALSNLHGHQYRVIVGSKIIREGFNFRAVRHQLVTALPTDYPTLLQVFGRVVRKDSHSELAEPDRDVRIRVLVTTRADGRPSPELQRYIDKGREYTVIQEVERALRRYSVDGFANYLRIRAALHAGPDGEPRAGLDGLPYSPVVGPEAARARPRTATFETYGHALREVAAIAAICRVLFRARPVWTYGDLWAAVGSGAVRGIGYDPALFDEGNFAAALESLRRPVGDPPMAVAYAEPYFVAARVGPDGRAILDIEAYLRDPPHLAPAAAPRPVAVKVADYIRGSRAAGNFEVRLRRFNAEYLRPGAPSTPELALVEYGPAFHYALLRRLVQNPSTPTTADDARIRALYRRFRIAITAADAAAPAASRVFRGALSKDPNELVGYMTADAVSLFDAADGGRWYNASHSDFGIGRRHNENGIIVGFVTDAAGPGVRSADDSSSFEARFKIRPPTQKLYATAAQAGRKGDIRSLARGAVCETRPREELEVYARRLRDAVARSGAGATAQMTRLVTRAALDDTGRRERFESDAGTDDDGTGMGDDGAGTDDGATNYGSTGDGATNYGSTGDKGAVTADGANIVDADSGAGAGADDDSVGPWGYDVLTEFGDGVGAHGLDGGTTCGSCRGSSATGEADARSSAPGKRCMACGGAALALVASVGYAAMYDRAVKKRFPSATELCDTLRLCLLALEENARAPVTGMTTGLRWLYLFPDRPPSVAAIMGRKADQP